MVCATSSPPQIMANRRAFTQPCCRPKSCSGSSVEVLGACKTICLSKRLNSLDRMLLLATMIKDSQAWDNWEKNYRSSQGVDISANLRLLEMMLEQARAMHVFPLSNPLQDIEIKINLAKAINVSKAA